MSILDRLFPRIPDYTRLQPQIEAWTDNSHLYDIVADDVLGAAAAWAPMTRAAAMRVPAVARARHLIAGTIASLPLRAYRSDVLVEPQPYWCYGTDGQLGDIARDDAIRWGLSVQSPWWRLLWTVDDHLFYGESLWLATATATADNRPLRLARVPYDHWSVEDGRVVDNDSQPFPADRVVYIPGPHEGILTYASGTVRQASDLEHVAGDVARHPIRFELHQTTDVVMAATERHDLITETRAALNANDGILFTNSAIQTIEHRLDSANDLVIAGRNAAALDVARHVSMPAAMLDATSEGASLEYQTTVARNQEWIDYGLTLYMQAVEARLSMDDVVAAGTHVAADLASITALETPATGPTLED